MQRTLSDNMASMLKLISLLVPALAFFTQEDTASQQPLKRKNQYTMATNKHARAESKFRVAEGRTSKALAISSPQRCLLEAQTGAQEAHEISGKHWHQ